MKTRVDDLVNLIVIINVLMNLNIMDMIISYSFLYESFEITHFVVKYILYTIEMNGLCKPNHVVIMNRMIDEHGK